MRYPHAPRPLRPAEACLRVRFRVPARRDDLVPHVGRRSHHHRPGRVRGPRQGHRQRAERIDPDPARRHHINSTIETGKSLTIKNYPGETPVHTHPDQAAGPTSCSRAGRSGLRDHLPDGLSAPKFDDTNGSAMTEVLMPVATTSSSPHCAFHREPQHIIATASALHHGRRRQSHHPQLGLRLPGRPEVLGSTPTRTRQHADRQLQRVQELPRRARRDDQSAHRHELSRETHRNAAETRNQSRVGDGFHLNVKDDYLQGVDRAETAHACPMTG